MKNKGPMFAPEGEGGAGGAGGDTSGTDTSTILYGSDTVAAGSGDDTVAGAEGNDTTAGGEGWQEYVDDPAKSADDNAAAKAEHDKTKPAEADPLDTVPEDGNYTLTLPDDMQVDEAMLGALAPAMKEAGITGKQANTLAAAFAAQQKAQFEQFGQTVAGWAKTAQADPEIGGVNWDASVANAQKVIKQFGSDGLREYLNQTGAGNHPEVIRLMAKVGAVISEDNPTSTSQGKVARDTVATLYPDDQPKG